MNDDVYTRYEHMGVIVEILHDYDPQSPFDWDNTGTILSWTRDFGGDKVISHPEEDRYKPIEDWALWFHEEYDSALTFLLRYADYGSNGARIYITDDDPNCVLVFTQKDLDEFTTVDDATRYAQDRIKELDDYLQGYVWIIRIRESADVDLEPENDGNGEILQTVGGFIGDPHAKYIREAAEELAEECAVALVREQVEAAYWAARDVVTI